MSEHSSIGTRFKDNYELRARHYLLRRVPVIIRVDGRAFHTLTRGATKPFDANVIKSMRAAAIETFTQMQGCKMAYIQSDEASFLLTDYDQFDTQAWFDYNKSKIETIAAATMSVAFTSQYGRPGVFDARAFNVPVNEVSNYFLWRSLDWRRNSVAMYAQANFSHNELQGKRVADMHEMLHGIGKNWTTDLSDTEKNGTFLVQSPISFSVLASVKPDYKDIDVLTRTAGVYDAD